MRLRASLPLLTMLCSISIHPASAQDTLLVNKLPLGIVDTVIVSGNQKTKAYVILDEMALKPGSMVTADAMEYDRNRIYSLGLFTRVDIAYDSLGNQHFLFVDVNERWYLIPYPILGFRDGDVKKVYYGGGLLHNNFQGKNQKLYGSLVLGYDPSLSLSFHDPLFDHEHNLFYSTSLSTSIVRNKSVVESALTGDFNERHYDINGTLGKRFDLYQTASVNPGFHVVDVSQYREGRTASTDGTDRFLYATVSYSYDSRDLREYATQGSFYNAYVTKFGFGESPLDFARYGVDVRCYTPLFADFSLATRAYATMVTGRFVPTYAHAFIGYGEQVRGYFNTVIEGEDIAGATVELRYPILKARTIIFRAIPLPPEFAIWRFGISIALFADAGNAWYRKEKLQFSSFASGYGAGIHFLLPYGYVARFEYAFNDYGRGQFILDLRSSI